MALFDPAEKLPRRLQSRIDSWSTNPPESQFQVYGPLNGYLQGHKFTTSKFLVKPQALLREEDAGEAEADVLALHVDDDVGDRSFDSHGVGVTNEKRYPDFTVCQYWGPDLDLNPKADVIRIIIEVGSDEENSWAVARQVLLYLDWAGQRWHGEVLGIAMVKNKASLFRNNPTDEGFYSLYGGRWISIFDPRFVEEINRICQYSKRTDSTTWN